MKSAIFLKSTVLLSLFWTAVQADSAIHGFLLYGVSDIRGVDLINENTELNRLQDEPQSVPGLAISFGHEFDRLPVQLELEYLLRYRFDVDSISVESSPRLFRIDIETHGLYLNGMYIKSLNPRWKATLGGGVGYLYHRLDTELLQGINNPRVDNSQTALGWHVTAGLSKILNNRWQINFRYRYSDLGSVRSEPDLLGRLDAHKYYSHDLLFGLSYRL